MNKRFLASLLLSMVYFSMVFAQKTEKIVVSIDLINVKDDKVAVSIMPSQLSKGMATFSIPKIIPGTYSEDDYGKFIEDVKAFDNKGKVLAVNKVDDDTWTIADGSKISKITYLVNDTFDVEGTHSIFSPAGTNIDAGNNFMLNTHAFVGYFKTLESTPYVVNISHPENLWGATSMEDKDASKTMDTFETTRYATLVENPIMYSKPDYTTFNIDGMEILIAVYSPTGKFTAEMLTPDMKTMMTAQKRFLGKFNSTKKYSVLIYLSKIQGDAHGFGALEHPTATTVVMPELMPLQQMNQQLKDIVSHEFFHIVTPLSIHSKEIQDFEYNKPKMSQHLWMYEGVTEYFANLFQVNQGLIDENEFFTRMAGKISNASRMNDTMPFTTMSQNVLVEPYKAQYLNVYEKGALIGMCIDIILREKSNGERGILDMMKKLSAEYGANKAFNDSELFGKITEITYPEVGAFLKEHVSGDKPIDYNTFLAKMGVNKTTISVPGNAFMNGDKPFITINASKEITVVKDSELSDFYKKLGIKPGDVITQVDGVAYNLDNIYDLITKAETFKNGDDIDLKIRRDGKEMELKGKQNLPMVDKAGYFANDEIKAKLREKWLKG